MKRIGHKGADSIRPGNTLESFEAAVGAGVEMIELDVLRPHADFRDGGDWRRAEAGPAAEPVPSGSVSAQSLRQAMNAMCSSGCN